MATKARPTLQKQAKERARQQKQREKAARRLEAKREKAQGGPRREGDEDPNIAGIRPVPQPGLAGRSMLKPTLVRFLSGLLEDRFLGSRSENLEVDTTWRVSGASAGNKVERLA